MRTVDLFTPGDRFPPVSITGDRCQLMCDHCRGRYLRGMRPAAEPDDLRRIALELEAKGAKGMLISGGSRSDGSIAFGPHLETVRWIKEETPLLLNLHTGLLSREQATALVETGADAFSVDIVRDRRLMREMMHLDVPPERYEETLRFLIEAGAGRVVPHICVGIPGSSAEGELEALDLVAGYEVSSLVVLAFVPTRGTPLSGRPSPGSRLIDFVRHAVGRLDAPVLLGCMRPRGRSEVDLRCLDEGASGLAVAPESTVSLIEKRGYRVRRRELCCALYP